MAVGNLKGYRGKRTFERTPEPPARPRKRAGRGLSFVLHKHAARALHYDLRLELDGVLKSWAVPKGPSMDPSARRLAVMVEDHPLDYRDFEGFIPEGNYGAGSVIIWDRGLYHHPLAAGRKESENLLREGLSKGHLRFELHGEKLQGEFNLVKSGKDDRSWLLMKRKDRHAGIGAPGDNRSVVTGRTLEEVAREGDAAVTASGREKLDRARLLEAMESGALRDAPAAPMPKGVKPMLASLAKRPFDNPEWLFEVKWDGYRAVAEVRGAKVSLHSRNLLRLDRRFPPVVESLRSLGIEAVLDGEIVVLDDRGLPDFQMLQHYEKGRGHLVYEVFDLLHLAGRDLTGLPLEARKELLRDVLPSAGHIRFSDHVRKDGVAFFRAAGARGLEGIMAKDSRSPYVPGARSRQWLKIKTRRTQDAVIAGFTAPGGTRKHFGALVLGVYEGDELVHVGNVGGGFGAKSLAKIHGKLKALVRKRSPFGEEPALGTVTWVKPELVCEVALAGWTRDGLMRQPIFLRLRDDKIPRETVREGPTP